MERVHGQRVSDLYQKKKDDSILSFRTQESDKASEVVSKILMKYKGIIFVEAVI